MVTTPDQLTEAANDLITLFERKCYTEAEPKARKWTINYPEDAFGWKILGAILAAMRQYQEAIFSLKKALAYNPKDAEIFNILGTALEENGQLEDAGVCYAQAARQAPAFVGALYNLAALFQRLQRFGDARFYYERVLKIDPTHLKSLNNLGSLLRDLNYIDEALLCYQHALKLNPNQPQILTNLGNLLLSLGRLHEALDCQQRAAQHQPQHPEILANFGNVLQHLGRIDEAINVYHQALSIKPNDATLYSKLLFTLNYHPDYSSEKIFTAYQEFDRRFGLPQRFSWTSHTNNRNPQKRLRLGYVSPDFRLHSSRYILEPLLTHHDRAQFELFAYAELTKEDEQTTAYRRIFDHWLPTTGMNDTALAKRIRADGIDILIDLAGHTAGNRLGVFAQRPAPVSVTYIGYGYTTGLSAIDYFLTDAVMTPSGSEQFFSERLWYLKHPPAVYSPLFCIDKVTLSPTTNNDSVVFGTLTRSVRINHRVIRVWSEILHRLPESRLIIDSKDFVTETMQNHLARCFAVYGIARERLMIGFHSPPWALLKTIDIGLDCFPHNSGTTLFESLSMGVPFITLADRPSVGRIGSAILTASGHPEWIAKTEAEYIDKAVNLASDTKYLAAIRAQLRADFEASPLCNVTGFTQSIEQAYRQMWQQWCATT